MPQNGVPTVEELRHWIATPRRLRDLIAFAENIDERNVKPALYRLTDLPIFLDRATEVRRLILISALSTRFLFRVLDLSRDLDLFV